MLDASVILAPLFLLPVVGLLRFIGCGTILTIDGSLPSVTVDPPKATLKPGEKKQFTGLADGVPSVAVTWSTNAPNGLFTAPIPFVPGSSPVKVIATNSGVTGEAEVTLVAVAVTVTPAAISLKPGESQQFTAMIDGGASKSVTWSPNAPGGLYTAPNPYVVGSPAVTITAGALGATGTAVVTLTGNGAKFVSSDPVTSGTWKGTYGNAGWALAEAPADLINAPAYLTALTVSPRTVFAFADPTGDPRGLQKPPTFANRFAAAWFANNVFTVQVEFADALTHRVAIYFVDWDIQGRAQKVEITDNAQVPAVLLDTRTLSAFTGGQYLIWDVSGKVMLRITKTAGLNAVMSGIFFA